jgi:hypothetical protein
MGSEQLDPIQAKPNPKGCFELKPAPQTSSEFRRYYPKYDHFFTKDL